MPIISGLTANTGYLLRIVSNAVSQEFARKMAGEGVTVAEWVMLRSLYDSDAIAPSVLAAKMGMTRGAISKLADRLLDKGMIKRTENPDDKRGHKLLLSVAGLDKVPVLAELADSNDEAIFAVLSGEDQARLRDLLHALIRQHGMTAMAVD